MNSEKESKIVPVLPRRSLDSNKGTFGRVLIVAGCRGMSGAAILCGCSCLRGGAGLVRIAVPESILSIVAQGNPCYMTVPQLEDDAGRLSASAENSLLETATGNNVIAMGPGLGRSDELTSLLANLVVKLDMPLVLDADGLNAFEQDPSALKQRQAATVITPHPGEFARLTSSDVATVQNNRGDMARRFASDFGVVVVLKGHATIVTDGNQFYENSTGSPALATGGTGDVLTGLIAALVAQKLEPFDAGQLGVYLHGLAGDLASREVGDVSLIATDLIDYLPQAIATQISPT